MKILLVVMKERRAIIDHLYDSIKRHTSVCEVLRLNSDEQGQLDDYFAKHVDVTAYDRIVFILRSKKMFRQHHFFQQLNNLVFLEYDAWQNYVKVKNKGKFGRLYAAAPWARIIVSGHMLAQRLRDDGFDAVFVPKGFDDTQLKNLGLERPIELGFIGSTNNSIYAERVKHLQQIAEFAPLQIARTNTAEEYLLKLNSIKFFVSADLGFNEYMLKNFEAMACGCVVFTFNHGDEENAALGFRDMENVVLYRDLKEFSGKLDLLRTDSKLTAAIAASGQELVEQRNAFSVLAPQIIAALERPLRNRTEHPPQQPGWLERVRDWLRLD
jgi:hypothetical protein